MKLLLTGSSGFIGKQLAMHAYAAGHEVTALDLHPSDLEHQNINFVGGSFLDDDIFSHINIEPDVVIHLAATMLPAQSNQKPLQDTEENLLGSVRFFENAYHKLGAKKYIFASSGGTVYGNPKQVPTPETAPTFPQTSYGISKLAIEKHLRRMHHQYGVDCISLRISNPFGPTQDVSRAFGALTTFCHKAVGNEPIHIWGDGSIRRDFIHVNDVADAFMRAIESDLSCDEINIGSGRSTSLNELVEKIEAYLACKLDVRYEGERQFDVMVSELDIAKAKDKLGWMPKVNMDAGIQELIDHLKQ